MGAGFFSVAEMTDSVEDLPAGSELGLPRATNARLPVAAVGASAGGVRALQEFFAALPEHVGVAFVVVVHLDPDSASELPAILATRTRMPVVQVSSSAALEADHVYVIPPNRGLRITDTHVSTERFEEPRRHRAPIDVF